MSKSLSNRLTALERIVEDATPPEPWGIIFKPLVGSVKYEGVTYATEEDARAAAGRPCIVCQEIDGRREVA